MSTSTRKRIASILSPDSKIDWHPYLYVLPVSVLYIVFLAYPFLRTFLLSFQEVQTLGVQRGWVGLENYREVLNDPLFWRSSVNTLIFGIGMVIIPMVLGLGLAVLINSKVKGSSIFRATIFIPVIVPVVVAGLTFNFILGQEGLLNWILVSGGIIDSPMRFITSTSLSLPSVMLMVVWKRTGYYMVILLAGLQGIPSTVYEAARVLGKSRWQTFRHVTVPLLRPALLITVVIGIIDTVKAFAQVYAMTGGGPSHSSETLATYFFKVAFQYYNFGKGAALGMILFAIALVVSLIVIRGSGGVRPA